jgi:hypothetical protein
MASEITLSIDEDKVFWCERDEQYIGFAAANDMPMPKGHSYEWLQTHCWDCGRSQSEIAHDQLEPA